MPEPHNDQPPQQPDAESQAMEWLYDTMDQKDPERGPKSRMGFPCATVLLLLVGVAIIAGVVVLLFGPPLAATEPEATATATATLALPTPTRAQTPRPALVPTASTVITTPFLTTFAIGDRVVITGTGERGVRIRAGAGLGFLTQGIYQDGDAFFIMPGSESDISYPVEEDGYIWWRLRAVDGLIGWAAEEFLLPAPLVTETPAP